MKRGVCGAMIRDGDAGAVFQWRCGLCAFPDGESSNWRASSFHTSCPKRQRDGNVLRILAGWAISVDRAGGRR
jgi:hypothetical protein